MRKTNLYKSTGLIEVLIFFKNHELVSNYFQAYFHLSALEVPGND